MKPPELRLKLTSSLKLIRAYDFLIDSYVLDFYTDNHWNQLPSSWKENFRTKSVEDFGELLSSESDLKNYWPLSVLCIKVLIDNLTLPRTHSEIENNNELLYHPKMKHIIVKNLNPKKRHEVAQMSQVSSDSAIKAGVQNVVDFGAGLGHLSRVIGYGFGLNMICLEMQDKLNEEAKSLDKNLERMQKKFDPGRTNAATPKHINLKLTKDMTSADFLTNIECKDNDFGIIGLHPCGDLSSILMKHFVECSNAKFLNLVGCCFMKLSEEGFPMSRFLKDSKRDFRKLSYESREIACHAIEMYKSRLEKGDYDYLRVHSFRAAVEEIIVKHWPHLRHSGLRSVKHTTNMTFEDYCNKAVSNLHITIPPDDLNSSKTTENLRNWKHVVILYTLRLMFAPLIESVIHYDRQLYLLENGCHVEVHPIFNPRLSPRNHLIKAFKY